MAVYVSPGDRKAHVIVTTLNTPAGPVTLYSTVRTRAGKQVLDTKTIFGKDLSRLDAELRQAHDQGLLRHVNKAAFNTWTAQRDGTREGASAQHIQNIEGLSEFFAQFDSSVKPSNIQASRAGERTRPLNTLWRNTREIAQQAARLLDRQMPGIVGKRLRFFANPAELLATDYAGRESFTPAEIAAMQEAEGFFDNDTGYTVIFTDSIDVRPGETPRAAVARVILHERVGHDGFNTLLQNDQAFAKRWEALAEKIPQADLDAIAADYPNLAADTPQLALEWLARAVEQRLHLRAGNLAQRLWAALRVWMNRAFKPFGGNHSTESALRDLIAQAQAAAQAGTAIPTTAAALRAAFAAGQVSEAAGEVNLPAINQSIDTLNQILAQGPGANGQLYLPNVGAVTVDWGNPGNPAKQFKQGFGLSHIIARRALVEGKDAAVWLQQLARTLHNGQPGTLYGAPGNPRIDISLGGQRAVISLQRYGQSESWLLTAFDDRSAAGATSGNVHPSGATHGRPSFTQADVVAAAQIQLPRLTSLSNPRLQFARSQRGAWQPRCLAWRALMTGSPLPNSLSEVLHHTQAEKAALDNAFARVASMLESGVSQAVTRSGQTVASVHDQVNAALDGKPGAMTVLQVTDPALAEAARRARNMMDDLSLFIARTLPAQSSARTAIIGNIGHWMRRSYQAFDGTANWNYESMRAAAVRGEQLNGEDARAIMRAAAAYLVSQDPTLASQRDAMGLPKPDTDLSATFIELLNRDTWATSLTPSGRSPRKNVTSLMRRKDIAPEIRRLMGEHTNPLARFTVGQASKASSLPNTTACRRCGR